MRKTTKEETNSGKTTKDGSYSMYEIFTRCIRPKIVPPSGADASRLVEAASRGDVQFLFKQHRAYGVDFNDRDPKDGLTPLISSACSGSTAVVEFLLQQEEVDSNRRDEKSGRTALLWACERRHYDIVRRLLLNKNHQIDVGAADKAGLTPVLSILRRGVLTEEERSILPMLLERCSKPSVDACQKRDGMTALHLACRYGHIGAVALLLKHGASVHKTDRNGYTALHWTCLSGNLKAAKMIVDSAPRQLRLDIRASDGKTPMILASTYGSVELTRYLHMKGARIPKEPAVRDRAGRGRGNSRSRNKGRSK